MNIKIIIIVCMLPIITGCLYDETDEFCRRLGFNDSDGWDNIGDYSGEEIKIKCDGEVQHIWSCTYTSDCINENEYGRCLSKGTGLWCHNQRTNETEWIHAK